MKLKLPILFLVCAILIASFGAAALSSVSLDRAVTGGTVLADTNTSVAVKFTAGTGYTEVLNEDSTTGEVSFDLSEVLTGTTTGFNTEAQFTIGSASAYVFQITNNTNISVLVTMSGAGGLSLYDASGIVSTGTTIASGATEEFYFGIDTSGIDKGEDILGTLSVVEA